MTSDFLIKLIVLFLPTQLGFHFWPAFSRVAGIKVDYLSPTLYFLDILLVILIFINLKSIVSFIRQHLYSICLFILFVIFNTVFAVSPLNTLFWWIHTLLYLLAFLTFRLRRVTWSQIRLPLLCGTSLVVLLEILQLCFQTSAGGLFYYLGERAFSSSTSGLGRFDLLGRELIRPMSTFSQPNSLAGYLLIVFYLFSKKSSKTWYRLIPFLGILLTFSKTSIIALAFVLFHLRPEIIILLSFLFTLAQPLTQSFSSPWQSLSDRLFYFPYLKKIIFQSPIFGVGLGNFIPSLGQQLSGSFLTPSKLQPIHNLYYLSLSELGLFGAITLTYLALKHKILKFLNNPLLIGLLALVLFTGALDHYTWTLPQNKLIFLLALAIML